MLDFQAIQVHDRAAYLRFLRAENTQNSSESFGNIFLWSLLCRRNLARCGERLCVEYLCRSRAPFYGYPIGEGDVGEVIDKLRLHAEANGRVLTLRAISAAQRDALEAARPGAFRFTEERDNFDYIYDAQALATLAGKKLHGKRNHCNRFAASHDWHSEALRPEHFDACREILQSWDSDRDGGSDEENEAIECAFRCWDELGLEGCILFAEGQAVAFSLGEFVSSDTFNVHFEKARPGVDGAYPMICREFVRQILAGHPETRYINREEDMGIPGLRKAKEDWHPLFLLEKYSAVWQEEV